MSIRLGFIDRYLNRVTMYRLVLVWLVVLVVAAVLFSLLGILPFNAIDVLASTVFLIAVSVLSNWLFARVFGAAANVESVYITALILALIISPTDVFSNLAFLAWAAILATACKYILAFRRKHVFNPAAFAVVVTSLVLGHSATWWVGTGALLPFVLVGGVLVVRKIRRFDLVWAFFLTVFLTTLAFGAVEHTDLLAAGRDLIVRSPLLFFAFAMLTEPLTTPPTRGLQMWYGALTGFLFVPQVHVGGLFFTPELALLVGNVFSYAVSPKTNVMLKLLGRRRLAANTYEFVFENDRSLAFRPGQYLEWTLPHDRADNRGVRRFLTIASPPGDKRVRLGVRFSPRSSSFKKRLLEMKAGESLFAGHLAGDFVLPPDPRRKLVLVAGGIGMTPFVSMIRDLLRRGEMRPVIVLAGNAGVEDIPYQDVLERAHEDLGIRTVHVLSDIDRVPEGWTGRTGQIDARVIREEVPDFMERTFYISGRPEMVEACKRALRQLGVKRDRVRTDYFPGFA